MCAGRCDWWGVGAEDAGSSVPWRGEAGPAEVTSTTRGQGQAPGDYNHHHHDNVIILILKMLGSG